MFKEKEYPGGSDKAAIKGIMLQEELDYGHYIKFFISLWWIGIFVLQIFDSPQWLIYFGLCYGVVIAVKSGGNDISDGVEEFSFSLAPTRTQRFKAKFIYGFRPLVILTILGALSIFLNIPKKLWSIFVETGFTQDNQSNWLSYSLALFLPLTYYIEPVHEILLVANK